jgi:hypothetical protein
MGPPLPKGRGGGFYKSVSKDQAKAQAHAGDRPEVTAPTGFCALGASASACLSPSVQKPQQQNADNEQHPSLEMNVKDGKIGNQPLSHCCPPKSSSPADALAAIEAGCARLLVNRMIMSSFGELGGTSAAAAYIEAGYKANAGNKAFEGAYFAKHLEQARQQGRIGQVAIDPILPVKAFMDIGGAGHSSDTMAIWICQFVGREIRLIDYIEGVGQPLAHYAGELEASRLEGSRHLLAARRRGHNNITGKRYIDHWREAGFECETPIKNTGAGAAMMRVEAARRIWTRTRRSSWGGTWHPGSENWRRSSPSSRRSRLRRLLVSPASPHGSIVG